MSHLVLAAWLIAASVQAPPADEPAEASPPATQSSDEQPVLQGPDITAPTLVRYDFEGNFVAMNDRPELAAIALLDDVSKGELARQAATDRVAALSRLLADQIDILRDATDAIRAGDNARAQELQRQLYEQFDPEHQRDPLLVALKDELSGVELDRVHAYLDEYWNAWIAWELRNQRGDMMMNEVDEATTKRAQEALSYRLFQRELTEAYRIAIRPLAQRLERIYAAVEPSDEQRAEIREIMLDYIRETQLDPTDEARQRATARIFDLLDEVQQRKVMAYVMWGQ